MEKGKEKSKEKSKEKILALLSVNPHATTADLISETGLSVSGVEKNIRELKATGRLRRVGPDKGGGIGKLWKSNRNDDETRREPECRIQGTVARQVPRMDLRLRN